MDCDELECVAPAGSAERERARKLYRNKGLHRNAEFIADLHPLAVEYLEQAPILACSFGVKRNTRADRLYIASRIGGPIQRGAKLRDVMASVSIPYALRKLSGHALSPYVATYVRDTAQLSASTLSQSIPEGTGKQANWLRSIRNWQARLLLHRASPKLGFAWCAMNAAAFDEGEAGDFADFILINNPPDYERWNIMRMRNEVELWHDRLNAEKSVKSFGMGIKADTIIDLSNWPDHAEIGEYEVFKLSTPMMIIDEGRRMRHCVSSYIPNVINGSTNLFSVRQEMRRVATVQVVGKRVVQIKAFGNKVPPKKAVNAADEFVAQFSDRTA